MDSNQSRITDLLREAHLIAFKEIERLNMRILELENQHRQPTKKPVPKPSVAARPAVNPATAPSPRIPTPPEMLNEYQVAEYVQMSVASVRRWRLFRSGPRYLKIGAAVRYRREDVESWVDSCSE